MTPFELNAGLFGDAAHFAGECLAQAAHGQEVSRLGGALDRLGDLAQGGRADDARGALEPMGGAGDDGEIVGAVDLTLGDAGSVQELALDLGQGRRIVAEQFDELAAIVCRGHAGAFSQTLRVALSCSMPIGLVINPSIPPARLFFSCSSCVLAVTARMGVPAPRAPASLSRMRLANSKPSMS